MKRESFLNGYLALALTGNRTWSHQWLIHETWLVFVIVWLIAAKSIDLSLLEWLWKHWWGWVRRILCLLHHVERRRIWASKHWGWWGASSSWAFESLVCLVAKQRLVRSIQSCSWSFLFFRLRSRLHRSSEETCSLTLVVQIWSLKGLLCLVCLLICCK